MHNSRSVEMYTTNYSITKYNKLSHINAVSTHYPQVDTAVSHTHISIVYIV